MSKWVREFLRLDLETLIFGFSYYFFTNLIGYEQSIINAVCVSVIFWVLMLIVLGFMGKFRENN